MPSPSSKEVFSYRHRGWKISTLGFVLSLHDDVIEASGGSQGIRDEGSLISALHAPVDSAGGEDAYEYVFEKVAALGYRIIANHPFVDGNKRTAFSAMLITLSWNGHYATWSEETETLVINLVGAGYLKFDGLKHALLFGCGYDVTNTEVTSRL